MLRFSVALVPLVLLVPLVVHGQECQDTCSGTSTPQMCTTSVVGNDGKTRCKRVCCRAEEECLVVTYIEGGVSKTGPACGAACRPGTAFCQRPGGNLLEKLFDRWAHI